MKKNQKTCKCAAWNADECICGAWDNTTAQYLLNKLQKLISKWRRYNSNLNLIKDDGTVNTYKESFERERRKVRGQCSDELEQLCEHWQE